jgi:hypothetical protein
VLITQQTLQQTAAAAAAAAAAITAETKLNISDCRQALAPRTRHETASITSTAPDVCTSPANAPSTFKAQQQALT